MMLFVLCLVITSINILVLTFGVEFNKVQTALAVIAAAGALIFGLYLMGAINVQPTCRQDPQSCSE